jgi:hypothetical protein
VVRYSVLDYSLESLEDALREAGFALDNSLYTKLVRALVYFCEETQRHNLLSPERLIKQSNEVYIQAWDHHRAWRSRRHPARTARIQVIGRMNDDQLLRYSRHILLPEIDVEGQEAMLDGRALVVGAGGLGSPVAMYLAAAGVGTLVIADDDTVDLTNLQRQILHSADTVGLPKVESARATLHRHQPARHRLEPIQARLEGAALEAEVGRADVVLDCCDNFATRHAINRACVKHRKPLVSGAAIRFDGQVSVFDLRKP